MDSASIPAIRIAVNGRFLGAKETGVQRYGREIMRCMMDRIPAQLKVLVPPYAVVDEDCNGWAKALNGDVPMHLTGLAGHVWEQLVLPILFRKSGCDILWSPCTFGPLLERLQVPVLHDLGPFIAPEEFPRVYGRVAKVLVPRLATRSSVVTTTSRANQREVMSTLRVNHDRTAVVPPGVGPPFTRPQTATPGASRDYCLFVGAHDARKNLAFVMQWWPEVARQTGLRLIATRRQGATTRLDDQTEIDDGLHIVTDPTDDELARLYAGALALLWPSRFEGFGLPLLEAMACGTPFLSSDTGAASELAVCREQIQPLERESWTSQIEKWHASGLGTLPERSIRRAAEYRWDHSAELTLSALERAYALK